ncbi:MAG TPA: hypothetical protein VHY77_11025 [Acidimicrobiales bacterium]|nr:hypothetical protein [Acidimicrobiales bacterium]
MVVIWALLALVLVGVVVYSFFVRRHGEAARPDANWTPTDEVFHDPSTDRVMRVWVDRAGQRHYVPTETS